MKKSATKKAPPKKGAKKNTAKAKPTKKRAPVEKEKPTDRIPIPDAPQEETTEQKPGTFQPGNNVAEKWTEETVIPILEEMLQTLTTPEFPAEEDEDPEKEKARKNLVRANSIKLAGEIRLMHGVTKQRWKEWREKFALNESVSDLMGMIDEILECRLIYSGSSMDQFILMNAHGYKQRNDTTSDDKPVSQGVTFLDLLKASSRL